MLFEVSFLLIVEVLIVLYCILGVTILTQSAWEKLLREAEERGEGKKRPVRATRQHSGTYNEDSEEEDKQEEIKNKVGKDCF